MRRLILAMIVGASPALAEPDHVALTDHAALAERALTGQILPGFQRLETATRDLAADADAACAAPGGDPAVTLRPAYDAAFDAWARIGFVRFGPVEEDGTGFGIEFWPDTKASTPRSLAALVAAEDPVVDDPAAFAGTSVAARGLMALDHLLYDPDAAAIAPGSYACRLLVAITRDLAATSGRLVARWQEPWGRFLTSAGGPDNPIYLAPEESTQALYGALADGLQSDIDLRLGRPLGTFERPQPRRAEAWRSERSMANLAASLQGLQAYAAFVFAPEIGDAMAPVDAAFAAAFAAIDRVPAPIDVEVATPQGRIHVEAVQGAVRKIRTEVASHIGPTIGVTSGFNALDGD